MMLRYEIKSDNDRLNAIHEVMQEIEMVKRDVTPFIRDDQELEIWSNDYFLQLSSMIKYL